MSTRNLYLNKLKKIISEDMKVIFIFLLLIFSIYNLFALTMGFLATSGSSFNTPSISPIYRSRFDDSDGDLLPDVIETAERGAPVTHPTFPGVVIGKGTGTNPHKFDTDGDLFGDGAEDNLGSDPNFWFDPGYLWVIWALTALYIILMRYRNPDRLKEYQEFESLQHSGGVSEGGSKFAHGGSSVFAKGTSGLSDEERREAIQSDVRFHSLTGGKPAEPKTKRKWRPKRLALQFFISAFIILWIIFISRQ
ncbi:MAG: thrombospondin type 3 repeat-containing protein [Candidatus Kariarchaeaceae archaeon]|jgi:hypothetical protein